MTTTREIVCPTCGAEPGKSCRSVRAGKPLPDNHAARRLLSIAQAAAQGVERVRKPIWSNPFDHLKIDIIDGAPGPWLHLFAPFNQECNGRDPVDLLIIGGLVPFDPHEAEFEPYSGPLPTSNEYKEDVAKYAGCLAQTAQR